MPDAQDAWNMAMRDLVIASIPETADRQAIAAKMHERAALVENRLLFSDWPDHVRTAYMEAIELLAQAIDA